MNTQDQITSAISLSDYGRRLNFSFGLFCVSLGIMILVLLLAMVNMGMILIWGIDYLEWYSPRVFIGVFGLALGLMTISFSLGGRFRPKKQPSRS